MPRQTHRVVQPAYERLGALPPRHGGRLNAREESLIGHLDENGEPFERRDLGEIAKDD